MLSRLWNCPWALLVLGNLFWAGNVIVGRAILGPVPPIALSFWRWALAFCVAFGFARQNLRRDWPTLRAHWKMMVLLAATGIAFFNTAAYIGLSGTTALNVLLLQSCLPLIVLIWTLLLFKEQPNGWQLVAVAISLLGVAFVAAHGSWSALLSLQFHTADLWILAAATIYGVYIVMLRRRPDVHPLSFLQVAMGLGALMVAPFYLWELSRGARFNGGWECYLGIGYMAVFPSFISYLFFNRGVQLLGGARAGQSTHLMPLFGSIMAVVFLGESLHFYHLIGVMLIGSGILLAQLKAQPAPIIPATPE